VPLLVGGAVCTLGAIGCALAPSIGFLLAMRLVQGIGGGIAATISRAVVIDVARGDAMARIMSILMALGGLAPAIAPVIGGVVLTVGGTWRTIFWILVGFGLLMTATAALFVPETLPPAERHRGGLGEVVHGFRSVLRSRTFVAYMLTGAFSVFAMLAYIANAAYILQGMKGMTPLVFSLFFASTALAQVGLSILNARLVGRFRVRRLIGVGLALSAGATVLVALSVVVWDAATLPICAGFLVLMASQAFIYGNSASLAVTEVTHPSGIGIRPPGHHASRRFRHLGTTRELGRHGNGTADGPRHGGRRRRRDRELRARTNSSSARARYRSRVTLPPGAITPAAPSCRRASSIVSMI
jgi:DHA1 family bicyclomycin/chloramphenicol resistance-like MFS transporter